jgi:hypothetical protein
MCEIERTRASLGKSTVMKYKGQDLDPNKLRRYAKMASRKDVVLPASRSQGLSDGGSSILSIRLEIRCMHNSSTAPNIFPVLD